MTWGRSWVDSRRSVVLSIFFSGGRRKLGGEEREERRGWGRRMREEEGMRVKIAEKGRMEDWEDR